MRHVVDLSVNNYPAVIFLVVFLNLIICEQAPRAKRVNLLRHVCNFLFVVENSEDVSRNSIYLFCQPYSITIQSCSIMLKNFLALFGVKSCVPQAQGQARSEVLAPRKHRKGRTAISLFFLHFLQHAPAEPPASMRDRRCSPRAVLLARSCLKPREGRLASHRLRFEYRLMYHEMATGLMSVLHEK
jgi:hypothetical protein